MSLINKERLLEDLREKVPLDWGNEGEEYGILLSRITINEQPTVEAIPVEWVKKWIFENPYFYVTGSTLLGDWQKEQRKEDDHTEKDH